MIVHGHHDRMIPVGNAQLMADRMPQARLEVLEQSGHLYPTEQPGIDETISAFIAESGLSDAPG
jgi:pimeloyl-ACP methyl ester carboxylesterase